jgi:hypothetical protein
MSKTNSPFLDLVVRATRESLDSGHRGFLKESENCNELCGTMSAIATAVSLSSEEYSMPFRSIFLAVVIAFA